ncbi:tRNA (adenosine(37)-N6)-threonylcarbamoyltransferase complex transferase subunit TsaD [Candidatus Woesearchaeota archaeon]|jgi:N6-L-threonylcarbamoyladenine synthase|nr:tRNA (adenosine(37)-N6)-threonylcarbamoyltransferase complex transferase subunit TsaD [Candidatus Woesearchaeota archaeon]MBT3538268.1 tRNA (adenosine(37)-N6)-threonylcarbamoyltransferase complex transferase subunit TsaD [Candidatus Woesearchaeota archaeon]MBT4696976.1 tRNA (adenosine(37)-N6)-threonylcarbamoyltransferase complex transferase subunit TsaD [Candidatus Woesearchaeota archaeon]MBT4717434.1 tRNA (adenosine(37)-N6)-threonylcarbamoyltransferase complex transferase subunit TsaD [Candi
MIVLGIESTAHTFGAAIIKDRDVLSNERDLFTTEEGGMKPFEVAQHHVACCDEIIKKALDKANVSIKNVDLISYSSSPGIGHTLRIGNMVAKSLHALHNIPFVGVNHCIAHLEIGDMTTGSKDPVLLYCSGANTQVIAYDGGKYRIFGETLDIGIGNFIDSFARYIKLGFPGGPKIEKLALEGNKEELIDLPYCVKGMDVVFGGILTNLKTKYNSKEYKVEDLCYSLQETVFAMMIETAERAMAHCDKNELLLGGGVACNKRLQEMARTMCEERGAKLFVPENQFLVDNAAMIAWQGLIEFQAGRKSDEAETATIQPYLRTDEVEVLWR